MGSDGEEILLEEILEGFWAGDRKGGGPAEIGGGSFPLPLSLVFAVLLQVFVVFY